MSNFSSFFKSNSMKKPKYTDCWLVGSPEDLKIIETYSLGNAEVVLGVAKDGELEYNITPKEYEFSSKINEIVNEHISEIRNIFRETDGKMNKHSIDYITKNKVFSDELKESNELISDIAYRYILGIGIFEFLLNDDRIEDIYVDAPCDKNRVHITMNKIEGFNTHIRCRTNLILDQREVMNIITRIKKEKGLQYSESNPVIETDIWNGKARITVVGYPLSPNGDSLAIRKHATVPWTLTRLISNGTITPQTAGLLSFLVSNRSTIIVGGARGAGKSSILSAMMFEFPLSQRILTIEDTMELPGRKMRELGYKIQSMLIDERIEGDAFGRAENALRISLRLGESAIVLGEVRGNEASILYQSMKVGKAGSSIMGTIHGDSAKNVYERVINDMGVKPDSFLATDFIMIMGTERSRGSMKEFRKIVEIVSTTETPGEFVDVSIKENFLNSPALRRICLNLSMNEKELLDEIETRSEMRLYLSQMMEKDEKYGGPEYVVLANDMLSKMLENGVTDKDSILSSFKSKIENLS